MAYINGRRILVPPEGITGQGIIQQMNPGPVRRIVMQKDGSFSSIDPKRIYKSDDLLDKDGNLVKFNTIPDRTKGAAYGGDRSFQSKQIITEQVFDVAENLFRQGVSFDEENADWMIANQFRLPPIWHNVARTADVLIIFPTDYPQVPPVGFYLKEEIPLTVNPHLYRKAFHDACDDPLTQGWIWYCVYINPGGWQPAPVQRSGDWHKGDSLWTYFMLISEVLSEKD